MSDHETKARAGIPTALQDGCCGSRVDGWRCLLIVSVSSSVRCSGVPIHQRRLTLYPISKNNLGRWGSPKRLIGVVFVLLYPAFFNALVLASL